MPGPIVVVPWTAMPRSGVVAPTSPWMSALPAMIRPCWPDSVPSTPALSCTLVPVRVVSTPDRITCWPYCCEPVVLTEPPLISTSPLPLVCSEAARTGPSSTVSPAAAMVRSPRREPWPTGPANSTLPLPAETARSCVPSTASLKRMSPSRLATVRSPPSVTAPLYDWSPVVAMLPWPSVDEPFTVRLASASCAPNGPFNTASPSIVRSCGPSAPPSRLTVLPFNTVSAPSTASSP
ncbi:hypothetical protein D3C71_1406120 [compost metagenome]